MSVDTILVKLMNDVPKAVAAGVVDMGTGMLLGVKTVDSHPQEVLDLVAAATKAPKKSTRTGSAKSPIDTYLEGIENLTIKTPKEVAELEDLVGSSNS